MTQGERGYVAYQIEEEYWETHADELRRRYPGQFLVISGEKVIAVTADYTSAARVLDGWEGIAIIQPTGESEGIAQVPHYQVASIE